MADFQPITPTLASAREALARRVPRWAPYLQSLPSPVARSFLDYSAARASRGQDPLSDPEAALALQAALTGQAQTPEPSRGGGLFDLLPNALSNVRDITTMVPQLLIPNRGNPLYQELEGAFQLPENVSTALSEGGNLGEDIANVLDVPGIRMIPGTYVAANIARGEAGELAKNPVFTALDVLPYASKAAGATRTVKAARAAHEAQIAEQLSRPVSGLTTTTVGAEALPTLRPPGALRTLATRRLEDGQVVPNRLGAVTQAVGDSLSRGPLAPVTTLSRKSGFGAQGKALRGAVRSSTGLGEQVRLMMTGDPRALAQMTDQPLAELISRRETELFAKHPWSDPTHADYAPDRLEAIGRSFESGEWRHLAEADRAYIDDYRAIQRDMARYVASNYDYVIAGERMENSLTNPWAQSQLDGELLPTSTLRRVQKADRALNKARKSTDEHVAKMEAAKRTLFGREADDIADAYLTLEIPSPAPPVTATRTLLDQLDQLDDSSLDAISRDLTRQLKTTLMRMETSTNPWTMMRNATYAQRLMGRMGRASLASLREPLALARREMSTSLRNLRYLNRTGSLKSTLRTQDKALANLETAVRDAMPDRYSPAVFDDFERRVMEEGGKWLDDDAMALARDMLGQRMWAGLQDLGLPKPVLDRFMRDAKRSWLDLKATGVDPVFLHHVSVDDIARLDYPRIGDSLITPSQVKQRTWDARPWSQNPSIALTHQQKELLETAATTELVDTLIQTYGRSELDLIREEHARNGGDWTRARETVEQTTVADLHTPFRKRRTTNVPGARAKVRVPKEMVDTLADLHKGSALGAIFDPVMKLFRTSVLPLSPRWHVYNVFGGAAIMSAKEPLAWRRFAKAYEQVGSPARATRDAFRGRAEPQPSTVPRGAPATRTGGSSVTVPERLLAEPVNSPNRMIASRQFLAGTKMRELIDKVSEWRASQPGGKGPFGRGVDASYALNSWFDDFYRTATSIESYERAIKSGKTRQAAEVEAARAVRSVMQNWDELLPLERQVLRSLFPFYSWARFSLGFVMRYPFDHPIRAAVISQFARNELEDMGTGLPGAFGGLFQLTPMDENGNARFLRTSGLNPFRDVTDWFTVQGFAGNANPIVSATLQALGVDPLAGPSIYPELQYDPETGGLKVDTPNFGSALITSTIPQARLIQNLVLGNQRFAELMQRDPEAARRQLLGQMGLPVMIQTENIPQEQFRAELNRYRAFQDTRRAAVREGDLGALSQYPDELPFNLPGGDTTTLGAYLEQLQLANSQGLLDPLRGEDQVPGVGALLRAVGGFTPESAYARQIELAS